MLFLIKSEIVVIQYLEEDKAMYLYGAAVIVFAGLTIGNFIWQAFGGRDWDTAKERSFFQGAALGTFLLAMAVTR